MATTNNCPFCGSPIGSENKSCPNCGGSNPYYIAKTDRQVFLPRTIGELKEYCGLKNIPLSELRFFIDEDYRSARAYGIYRDGEDFVVYKNKNDGTRAVRYRGPDEAHAVGEIFRKLLVECESHDVALGGDPQKKGTQTGTEKKRLKSLLPFIIGVPVAAVFAFLLFRCH